MTDRVDCVVIGAGVVGLAIARQLAIGGRDVIVLEAESAIGTHTSSRNSEVIHAGIYYTPGSFKARFCRDGREQLYDYCAEHGVAHKRLGKIIVGTQPEHLARLKEIQHLGQTNNVTDLYLIDQLDLKELEPQIEAHFGLVSPSSGIVDSHGYMLSLQGELEDHGGMIAFSAPVEGGQIADAGIALRVGGLDPLSLFCNTLINASGLRAAQVASRLAGYPEDKIPASHFAIGHYYSYSGQSPFSQLIYPVPEDGGLGIHVTLDMGGQARFGPDVRWISELDYRFDDSQREAFIAAIRSYYPNLETERLQPGYTGIRPKVTGRGQPASDFRIDGPKSHGIAGLVHLYGIESPGLTASLEIANYVQELLSGET
jgi:L-2-hydroxyglutarate oxidase LhgO